MSAGPVGLATAGVVVGLLAACARRLGRVAVAGTSMVPTFLPGDRLLVWRGICYRPGDLVVAAETVKRVVAVGEKGVTVAGDNPAASTDSRDYGPLPLADVRGRVIYRYAPAERAGRISRRGPRRPAG